MSKILSTTNYSLFELLDKNRSIKVEEHRELWESMQHYGFLIDYPISVRREPNGKLYIKDGQHRFTFAQRLNLPIFYIEGKVDYDVARVNSTIVKWNTGDYAESKAHQGIESYQELKEFVEEFQMPVGITAAMLSGTVSFTNIKKQFKCGGFKIKDRHFAERVGRLFRSFVLINKKTDSVRLIEALAAVCRVQAFDDAHLLHRADQNRSLVIQCGTKDSYMDMIERIYNFRSKQPFPLKFEAQQAMKARNAIKSNGSHYQGQSDGRSDSVRCSTEVAGSWDPLCVPAVQ